MPALSNFSCQHCEIRPPYASDIRFGLTSSINLRRVEYKTSSPFREVVLDPFRRAAICPSIRMAMVDGRLADRNIVVKPADILAYHLVQGADVHADNPDGLFRILSFSFQGF